MKKTTRALALAATLTFTPQIQTVHADGELVAAFITTTIMTGGAAAVCTLREWYKLSQIDYFFHSQEQAPSLGKAACEILLGTKDATFAFRFVDEVWPMGPALDPLKSQTGLTNDEMLRVMEKLRTWKNNTYANSGCRLIFLVDQLSRENELLCEYKAYLEGKDTLEKSLYPLWRAMTLPLNNRRDQILRLVNHYIERIDKLITIITASPDHAREVALNRGQVVNAINLQNQA